MASVATLPLPRNPVLRQCASVLNDAGYWAHILDASWQVVFLTDEVRVSYGVADMEAEALPIGRHWFSTEWVRFRQRGGGSWTEQEFRREHFRQHGPYALAGMPGGHEGLRQIVDPELADLVQALQPLDLPQMWSPPSNAIRFGGEQVMTPITWIRIDDSDGQLVGVVHLGKPAAGMSQLAAAAATADLGHLERMRIVEQPDRRPAAILIADLEASSPLARRLSTAQYFAFGRRLVRAADQCIVDEGGIVGRHAGDGVVAFFLAETAGSESAAARSCISAARALRGILGDLAERTEIPAADISVRFGLHWGATLYVGRILTAGRSEVTALGDEVNEAARIEASASGGRSLASKALVERLNHADAADLGIDTGHTRYTPLAELATATEKARRDAPSIAVCEV
jgi:class 3 adenylate cyclase